MKTLFETAEELASGRTSAEDLIGTALQACRETAASINAFAFIDAGGALAAARESDARRRQGATLGILDGIPVSVKDNIFVKGLPASWGSLLFDGFVPDRDDLVVERLRAAGAVILGKTTTPEFSLGGRTWSLKHGHTRNPLHPDLTPGGSSGGAAASVAAGIVPLAIGTDAGGSIRLPASYTGLYGLRPSTGGIARRHGFPPLALDYQVIGLLTRTLGDLRLAFSLLRGPDIRDPLSTRLPARSGSGRKAGWLVRVGDDPVDPVVAERVREAAERMARAGWTIVQRTLPCDIGKVRSVWATLTSVSVWRLVSSRPLWEENVTPSIANLAAKGRSITCEDYAGALDDLSALQRQVSEGWGDMDVLLTPTAASPAWPVEDEFPRLIDGIPGHPRAQSVFAGWVNAVGYPALSIPAASHSDGRPIGVQIVGRFGDDDGILEIADLVSTGAGLP